MSNYATKHDWKTQYVLIHHNLLKKDDLANLKPEVDKLDIYKLEKVPSGLNNLKSKVVKLDVDKLATVPTDLSKLSNVVKIMLLKKMYMILISTILKVKCLVLLT